MNTSTLQSTVNIVGSAFDALSQKLKMPAEQLFSWSIQNNYAVAIQDIVISLLCVVGIIYAVKYIKWGIKKDERGDTKINADDGIGFIILAIIAVVSIAICALVIFNDVYDAIPRIFAPQFHALQDLVGMVK